MTGLDLTRTYSVVNGEGLDAAPVGAKRDFNLAGIYVLCQKQKDGKWRVYGRRDIPSAALGRCPSVAYDKKTPPVVPPPKPKPTLTSDDHHLAAVARMAAGVKGSS